jgi:LmbE family N-acetylglucosaminyl deacetylase
MVRVIRRYRPKLMLTAHWDDPHPDHANTSRIVREAARLASMRRYDADSGQPEVRVPAIAHTVHSRLVATSFIVDISEFLERKMEAIRAHASQFYTPDSNEPATRISAENFLDMIETRSRYQGSLIGVAAGEAFFVREVLNVDDPFALLTRPMNIYS